MKNDYSDICVKCAECCRWMTFIVAATDHTIRHRNIEYYRARGCTVREGIDHIIIMVPFTCPHLEDRALSLKRGQCDIYENRPAVCMHYDGRWDPNMCDRCKLPTE